MSRLTLLAIGLGCTTPGVLAGQRAFPSVPKFPIEESSLVLRHDVRPHQYLGVLGRAAAWLGTETGEAELWVHPLKLADGFRLAFTIPDYLEPVQGADVARTVQVRPELTTITYTHATFTVRQHILAPLDLPGLLVLLDVETLRPLEITASFQMVFQYAWPASFGGQYVFWSADHRAFVQSESLRRRNGIIGSPWATRASEHPAHALPDAPNTFVIPVDTARARVEYVPIAIAAGTAERDTVLAVYHRLLRDAETLYREKRAYADRFFGGTTHVDTPDEELDLALRWSMWNLDEALVCNPDLGCGLVAGWGPSGTSTRPGFGWFFGGDAAINSFAMAATGHWDAVAQGLRFLARYQRDDGKIPHEISQAAAHIPWFTDFPYAYYHADTTPYWIVAVWRYWRASGDDTLVRDLWPSIDKAYRWCLSRDTDDDGIIENGPGNLGAIEVGALGEGIHQDIYLAAVWMQALEAMAQLADARGDETRAREARVLAATARGTLNERYWREKEGHYAFGILLSGGTNDNLTVWPATAAAFRLFDDDRADRTLTKLATDSVSADWGARILSTGSPLYDPMHYNNGAVWPFVTGFVVWGQYAYRRPWSGYPLIDALKQLAFDWARGRHPELLSGRYYRPLDTAVPQQFFATSMLVAPVMHGLLGWEPDASGNRATLAPQLPPHWDRVVVRNLRVGSTTLLAVIAQTPFGQTVTVTREGPEIEFTLVQSLPPGTLEHRAFTSPRSDERQVLVRPNRRESQVLRTLPLTDSVTTFELSWTGGLTVEPPTVDLDPGQQSTGLRILDFRRDGSPAARRWRLTVEGQRGASYRLRLLGEPIRQLDGADVLHTDGATTTIVVTMPAGPGRTTTSIILHGAR